MMIVKYNSVIISCPHHAELFVTNITESCMYIVERSVLTHSLMRHQRLYCLNYTIVSRDKLLSPIGYTKLLMFHCVINWN